MKRHGYFASLAGIPAAAAQVLRPPRRLFAPEPFAFETTATPAPRVPPVAPRATASPQSESQPQPQPQPAAQPAAAKALSAEPAQVEPVIAASQPTAEPRTAASAPPERIEAMEPKRPLAPTRRPHLEAERPVALPPHSKVTAPAGETREAPRAAAEGRVVGSAAGAEPSKRAERQEHADPPVRAVDGEGPAAQRVRRPPRSAAPPAPSLHIGAIDVTVVPPQREQAQPAPAVEPAQPRAAVRPLQRPGPAPWYGLGQR